MKTKLISVFLAAAVLTGCGSDPEKAAPTADVPPPVPSAKAESGDTGVFGWLGAGSDSDSSAASSSKVVEKKGVAVNAYLWRASLATLSYTQLEQTDPFAGVIKSQWRVSPENPNERFKVGVVILDTKLRAEAVRVSIFKEVKKPTGEWVEASVDPNTVVQLENIILDRARALKIQAE